MLAWAKDSLPVFKALAQDPDSGVVWRPHTEYFQQPVTRPAWMNLLPTCETEQSVNHPGMALLSERLFATN